MLHLCRKCTQWARYHDTEITPNVVFTQTGWMGHLAPKFSAYTFCGYAIDRERTESFDRVSTPA